MTQQEVLTRRIALTVRAASQTCMRRFADERAAWALTWQNKQGKCRGNIFFSFNYDSIRAQPSLKLLYCQSVYPTVYLSVCLCLTVSLSVYLSDCFSSSISISLPRVSLYKRKVTSECSVYNALLLPLLSKFYVTLVGNWLDLGRPK